jgi:tetratricopeptide (TPR) repeat protein
MRARFLLIPAFAMVFCLGCQQDKKDDINGIRPVNSDAANELNANRSQFDSVQDPPLNADTRYAAGQLAESQNNPQLAIKQYAECVKANPNHTLALYRMGVCYSELKQFPEAVATWNKYIKIYANTPNAAASGYSNLGFCYELAGQREDAENSYKKGIQKDPYNQACRVNYGLMLARTGKTSEAMNQLQVVLSPAEVRYNLGSVYEQLGRKEQAKAEYKKALELDPNLIDAQTKLTSLQ